MSDPFVEAAIRRILARRQGHESEACPDANVLAAYLESRLTAGETSRFEEHASHCAACQETLALSLQLEDRETVSAGRSAYEPRRFSYSSSPVRFALAAVVVAVVGLLLFQATRESRLAQPAPQVANKESRPSISGGSNAALISPQARTTSPATHISSERALPPAAANVPPQARPVNQPAPAAISPAIVAAPPAPVTLDASNIVRPQAPARAEAVKPEVVEMELRKQAQLDAEALKMKVAGARPEDAKMQAGLAGQQTGQMIQQAVQPGRQAAVAPARAAQAQATAQGGGGGRGGGGGQLGAVAPIRMAQAETVKVQALAFQGGYANKGSFLSSTPPRFDLPGPGSRQWGSVIAKESTAGFVKKLGTRAFYLTTGNWIDAECALHPEAPFREINRNSKEYQDILAKEPALAELHFSGIPFLLYWNGTNYRIR